MFQYFKNKKTLIIITSFISLIASSHIVKKSAQDTDEKKFQKCNKFLQVCFSSKQILSTVNSCKAYDCLDFQLFFIEFLF